MGKQKKIFRDILDAFEVIEKNGTPKTLKLFNVDYKYIRSAYKYSLNKKDLTRRILFDALLSDDDILKLLRIIFDKENKK